VGVGNIIPVASLERKGREQVLEKIDQIIKNFYEPSETFNGEDEEN